MKDIIFTNVNNVLSEFAPVPASKMIPDWYKDTKSYINEKKQPDAEGAIPATIKRCMPVFDVLNSGYYLLTQTDIWISQKVKIDESGNSKKVVWYQWPSYDPIEFHKTEQADLHPTSTGDLIPKWINPWGIKTSKGSSCLFIPPVHRENKIVAFPAVVDTDKYHVPVNIVFSLADPDFEGLIPAGTPIVQVIPFERNAWKMSIGTDQDLENVQVSTRRLKTRFFDSYKTQFRQNKEYK
jgi:hypothetical protein